MSPEAPSVIPDPPASEVVAEVPAAPVPEMISPPPAGPEAVATPEVAPPVLITVPESIQADLDAKSQAEQAAAQAAADAAKRVIGPAPGILPTPTEIVTPPTDNGLGGRFGMGVVEAPMPPDPSKVPGWNGEVRH